MNYCHDLLGHQTSNSSPFVTSASTVYEGGTYGNYAYKAFDSTSDFWANNSDLPCWLKVDFGAGNAKQVQKYTVYSTAVIEHRPDSWTFQGSNNNSTWTVLDTQTGQLSREGVLAYEFSNAVAYRYYRLHVTVVGSHGRIGITSLTMHEAANLLASPLPSFHRA